MIIIEWWNNLRNHYTSCMENKFCIGGVQLHYADMNNFDKFIWFAMNIITHVVDKMIIPFEERLGKQTM